MVNFYATIYEKGQRDVNQDSIALHKIHTRKGEGILAIVCDGMGGMDEGEIASGFVVQEMSRWFYQEYAKSFVEGIGKKKIERMIIRKLFSIHEQLVEYGINKKIHCGTTITLLLVWNSNYIVVAVGDSRAFLIGKRIKELTKVLNKGHQLLGCIGIGRFAMPEIIHGKIRANKAFLLMTDGLAHRVSYEDLHRMFSPYGEMNSAMVSHRMKTLVHRMIERGEEDNMSAIYLNF